MHDDEEEAGRGEVSLNHSFVSVAYWLGIVGRVTVLFAFFVNAMMLFSGFHIATLITSLFMLWIGVVALNTTAAFRNVRTEDSDAGLQIRDAMLNLRDLFRLVSLVIAIQSVVVIVLVLISRG